jgi:sugar lactone lactonase YvrE
VRISPEGNVDRLIELPFSNPTTCTFGGEDLRTLYITSARVAAGPNDVGAGGLFKMRVETPGLPERLFQPI